MRNCLVRDGIDAKHERFVKLKVNKIIKDRNSGRGDKCAFKGVDHELSSCS